MIEGQTRIVKRFAWFPTVVTADPFGLTKPKKKLIWLKSYNALQEYIKILHCGDDLGYFDYSECGYYFVWETIKKMEIL